MEILPYAYILVCIIATYMFFAYQKLRKMNKHQEEVIRRLVNDRVQKTYQIGHSASKGEKINGNI